MLNYGRTGEKEQWFFIIHSNR